MQVLASIGGWGDWLYYLVVPFLFVLTIVVFFHELGHFLVARWCGIRVQVFSIGFGRALFGFSARPGTRWKRAALSHAHRCAVGAVPGCEPRPPPGWRCEAPCGGFAARVGVWDGGAGRGGSHE